MGPALFILVCTCTAKFRYHQRLHTRSYIWGSNSRYRYLDTDLKTPRYVFVSFTAKLHVSCTHGPSLGLTTIRCLYTPLDTEFHVFPVRYSSDATGCYMLQTYLLRSLSLIVNAVARTCRSRPKPLQPGNHLNHRILTPFVYA